MDLSAPKKLLSSELRLNADMRDIKAKNTPTPPPPQKKKNYLRF